MAAENELAHIDSRSWAVIADHTLVLCIAYHFHNLNEIMDFSLLPYPIFFKRVEAGPSSAQHHLNST